MGRGDAQQVQEVTVHGERAVVLGYDVQAWATQLRHLLLEAAGQLCQGPVDTRCQDLATLAIRLRADWLDVRPYPSRVAQLSDANDFETREVRVVLLNSAKGEVNKVYGFEPTTVRTYD